MSKLLSPDTTFDARIAQRTASVGIVGLGYAGLPLGMAFAEAGFDVTGIDLNERRVRDVQGRRSYLVDVPEERYESLDGNLAATTEYAAVRELDALTICVPTPLSKTRTPDLNYIVSAAESVGSNVKPGTHVIVNIKLPGFGTSGAAYTAPTPSGLKPFHRSLLSRFLLGVFITSLKV